jgi:hypothetical protein
MTFLESINLCRSVETAHANRAPDRARRPAFGKLVDGAAIQLPADKEAADVASGMVMYRDHWFVIALTGRASWDHGYK